MSKREPFGGRYWGIWDVEGESDDPLAMFYREEDAEWARP